MTLKEIGNDDGPAIITDHAFIPRKQWWSLCEECGLAQAAHAETTINSREYLAPRVVIEYSDDNSEEYVVET